MADKKDKLIWVKALIAVQKPDWSWAEPGDVFQIMESKKSKRDGVMTDEVTKAEIEAAKAALPAPKVDPRDAKIAELEQALEDATRGRDIAFEAANELQCELGDVLEKIKGLKAPPIGGAKKGGDGDNAS